MGLACRFPDADDTAGLLNLVTTGRRAFRRIPGCRVDLADYLRSDSTIPDSTYSARAAVIEGWHFDRSPFDIDESAHASADPAVWLALETAARVLAAAGCAGGAGLPADRAGAFIGNTLAGDVSRAAAVRLRWPYARRVLTEALSVANVPEAQAQHVLRAAADRYLTPLPPITAQTLSGGQPGTIAATICRQFGFRGTGITVDAGAASSLSAVASACLALISGELDLAIAGGVDVSLDPLDLVGMAKAGVLATGRMRIYDKDPSGYLPGEGCGMVLLMRTADARAAGLPVYAEILGWGAASPGTPADAGPSVSGLLLAMRRAYEVARVSPADVQLVEGCGSGIAATDEAELAALAELRAGAPKAAALGAISANIGNTRAAAGTAGLIKAVLAMSSGVLPPSTGIRTPHPVLSNGYAALRCLGAAEVWPGGVRHASVSALGAGELAIHLVLRNLPDPAPAPAPRQQRTGSHALTKGKGAPAENAVMRLVASRSRGVYSTGPGHPFAYLMQTPDRAAMLGLLARISTIAPSLSDAQLQDLAIHLTRTLGENGEAAAGRAGPAQPATGQSIRIALVASRQEQLARLASDATRLLPALGRQSLLVRPGIFAGAGPDQSGGRVALLLAGQGTATDLPQHELSRILAITNWLDKLGVQVASAAGYGIGELAGLVWAGCLSQSDARALAALRSAALTAAADAAPGRIVSAIDALTAFEFDPPKLRLVSGCTGREIGPPDSIAELLSVELFDARLAAGGQPTAQTGTLAAAIRLAATGAGLLVQTGQDRDLAAALGEASDLPTVSIDGDPGDDRQVARAAAALFALGALARPQLLYADKPSRPIDLWRDQTFITHPCELPPPGPEAAPGGESPAGTAPRTATTPARISHQARADELGPVAGVAAWARCYVEQFGEPAHLSPAGGDRPWRVHTGECDSLSQKISELFRHDPTAGRTLAVLGGLDDAGTHDAMLLAVADAISTGQLVVVSPGPALAGLWASLHAEHPAVGITVIRAPLTPAGLHAAAQVATVAAGQYRELAVGTDGTVSEPAMVPVQSLGGADFPLGQGDVVLISRGSCAAGLTFAQVLACSGAAVAIVGRHHPEQDGEVIAGLEKLRSAGARIGYEVVDMTDHGAMVAAVRRVEARFGRVTAISHATGPTPRIAVDQLSGTDVNDLLRRHTAPLDQMVTAVRAAERAVRDRPARLRLIATFGSVVSRYGLAGEGVLALASGALADYAERLAATSPGCRALHVDWPAWSGAGLGERAELTEATERSGFAPLPVEEGSRILLRLLATHPLPARTAVHGRVGVPAPVAIAAGQPSGAQRAPGRFIERVLVHYPGVELIAEAALSLRTDPYLADYLVDGVPVLPPVMALEAMAQAASVLAGTPVRRAAGVRVDAPVVLPAGAPQPGTVIRICALREADAVTVVLRSDNCGFAVDHCRAVFDLTGGPEDAAGSPVTAGDQAQHDPVHLELPGPAAPAVDASALYGTVCFQDGRFRRLATVYQTGPGSAIGLARGTDDLPWFGADRPAALPARRSLRHSAGRSASADGSGEPDLVLGSAAISDATIQLMQACVPQRRLTLGGCDFVEFTGRTPAGVLMIRVRPALLATPTASAAGLIPRQRATVPDRREHGPGSDPQRGEPVIDGARETESMITEGYPSEASRGPRDHETWDADVVDASGELVARWRGVRMHDAGPAAPASAFASSAARS